VVLRTRLDELTFAISLIHAQGTELATLASISTFVSSAIEQTKGNRQADK
jgi:hypothetical protein